MADERDDFGGFDPEAEKGASSVVPEGDYRFVIENLVMKNTKNGVYEQAVATFQVLAGEFINRKIFERYNFRLLKGSATPQQKTAVAMGRKAFADLCKAVDLKPKKCAELIGKSFVAKVSVKKAEEGDEWGDKNRIKKYSPANTPISAPATTAPSGAKGDWNS
jgi:hypothetical protein